METLSYFWQWLSGLPVFLQVPLGLFVFFATPYVLKGIAFVVFKIWLQALSDLGTDLAAPFRRKARNDQQQK